MASPVSARLDPALRRQLAKYCASRRVTQTDAIAEGVRRLLAEETGTSAAGADRLLADWEALDARFAGRLADFDAEAAAAEGRD